MVVKFVTKKRLSNPRSSVHQAEEADFYRRNADGPVTVARRADDPIGQKPQAPRRQSQEEQVDSDIELFYFGLRHGLVEPISDN
jgi:hypothetical protein